MIIRRFAAVVLLLMLVSCRPQTAAIEEIPTLASMPAAQQDLVGAEQVAREFLDAWARLDYVNMYENIALASRDAYPFETFQGFYTSSHTEMTLDSVAYTGNTLARDGDRALFNYDVTFNTRVLNSFTDPARNLTLIYDNSAGAWRVAWSPGDVFAEMSDGGRLRLDTVIPPRGNIYDRTGLTTLADQNARVAQVRLVRQQIPAYEDCLAALSLAMDTPLEDLRTEIDSRPADWLLDIGILAPAAYEAHYVTLENTCNAQFEGTPVRNYPAGPAAANLIGYVGYPETENIADLEAYGFNQGSIIGRSGIEKTWDTILRGQPGGDLTIVSPDGRLIRTVASARPRPPQSLWLTIDLDLQQKAAEILQRGYAANEWPASVGASIVVMDVNTGAILAMVTYPTFDNNAFTQFPIMGETAAQAIVQNVQNDPRLPQLNRPALGTYPLGSVMKLVTSMAAADSGVYRTDERFTCTGIWSRDITRYDWNSGHGTITLTQAIERSCNPFYYEAGYQLDMVDPFILPSYARRVGFGSATGIDAIAEAPGQIVDPDWWRVNVGFEWNFSESVNMAIGQGYLQVTPLQVTRMVAAIANGGTLYRPQLIQQAGLIGDPPTMTFSPEAQSTLDIRPDVLEVLREGMCNVTTQPFGTATFIFEESDLQLLGVCGKTGTAQAPPSDIAHAWFGAYAPRENPEVAVVVMIENGGEGSVDAAPVAREVLEYYFFGQTN